MNEESITCSVYRLPIHFVRGTMACKIYYIVDMQSQGHLQENSNHIAKNTTWILFVIMTILQQGLMKLNGSSLFKKKPNPKFIKSSIDQNKNKC